MKEKIIKSIIDLIQTHTEHNGGYCDTGDDMEWFCRSECVELAIKRLKDTDIISQALDQYADWKISELEPYIEHLEYCVLMEPINRATKCTCGLHQILSNKDKK